MPMRLPDRCLTVVIVLLVGLGAGETALGNQIATEAAPAIRLYGVVRQPGGGVALLRFGAGRPVALRVGESHRGFTVREVLADGVQLEAPDGRTLVVALPDTLTLAESGELPPLPEPPMESEGVAEVPSPSELTPLEPPPAIPQPSPASPERGERRFSRDDVRLRLQSELPRILAGAVVAPRVLGNEVVGLELVAFPTDTVLGETGLTPGDVLLAVNGREVRGAESLAVLVQRFQTASEIEITVDRDGEIFPLRYRIE